MESGAAKALTIEAVQKKLEVLLAALRSETDIIVAVVATSYLEHAIGALLRSHFASGGTSEKLLKSTGVLGSFQAKIDLAYCLGMISGNFKFNLERIADIRNRFAHTLDEASFSDPKIVEWCNALKKPRQIVVWVGMDEATQKHLREQLATPKNTFISIATSLAVTLLMAAVNTQQCTENTTDLWTV
jgi:DNA-binding MltR family transcriptional regulator